MVWKFGSATPTFPYRKVVQLEKDSPVAIFVEDLLSVCRKHGFSLGHEDMHGGFEIYQYDASFDEYLRGVHACIEPED